MIDRIVSFEPKHLRQLDVQPMQKGEEIWTLPEQTTLFSLFEGETLQAIIGFVREDKDRVLAVSLLSAGCGRNLRGIIRAMKRCYDIYHVRRVEMLVRTDFKEAHRMARMLGYQREGTLRAFANGTDYDMYARIAEEI